MYIFSKARPTTKAATTAAKLTVPPNCPNFPYKEVPSGMSEANLRSFILFYCPTTKGMLFEFEFALILIWIKVC